MDNKDAIQFRSVCDDRSRVSSQTQAKYLHESVKNPQVSAPAVGIKIVYSLISTGNDLLKQHHVIGSNYSQEYGGTVCGQEDGGTFGSQDDGGTFSSKEDGGTVSSKEEGGTVGNQDDGGTVGSQGDSDTDSSQEDGGAVSSKEDGGTVGSKEDGGTAGSQDDGGTVSSKEEGGTFSSKEEGGTVSSQQNGGTVGSQGDSDNDSSNEDGGAVSSKEDGGTVSSKEEGGTASSQEDGFIQADEKTYLLHGTEKTQVSEGGEADLHKHYNGCEKNPGHLDFVPVEKFNINHLPEGYRDNDLVEYIKVIADLCVKIDVKMTSTARPEFWPNTTDKYMSYDRRGKDNLRVGTGSVYGILKWTEEFNRGNCPCNKCQQTETPSKVWGVVTMTTAAHVVFDDVEARHTTCRLFYDRKDSSLVTLDGWTVDEVDIKEDWCRLECVTCDVKLLDKLYEIMEDFSDLWQTAHKKYEISRNQHKFTFIVSHPHGCTKQISIGQWISRDVEKKYGKTKYTYTTCTCPGSSGARVYPLGFDWWNLGTHVHSGVDSKKINESGVSREY